MPPDVRDNIFTPYFSTKGEGGSGLGVPIVANAVQTHSGALSLRSAPGEGTIFTIMWPLHAPTEGRPSDDILRPTYPGLVDKTILLLGSDTPEERAPCHRIGSDGRTCRALRCFGRCRSSFDRRPGQLGHAVGRCSFAGRCQRKAAPIAVACAKRPGFWWHLAIPLLAMLTVWICPDRSGLHFCIWKIH